MICVLMVASGAAWESDALGLLHGRSDIVVLKRCVDVDDLLASAAAGQADVAVVALDAPGLDTDAVDRLRRHQVRPVAVVPTAALEAATLHLARLGITTSVPEDRLAELVDAMTGAEPAVAAEEYDADEADLAGAGRVVVVWGPQGAPGRTTVAVSCAAELAARGARTVLLDADPYAGAVAQQLGIVDEVSGLLAAARLAAHGSLADRFATVQRNVAPHLNVITGLPRADRWAEVRHGVLEHLVDVIRARAHVVVDTGFSLEQDPASDLGGRPARNALTLAALQVADEVVVVGSADPVGLSRLARGLVELRELLGLVPVRVVVNHSRASLGWSEREVAGMVEGFARVRSLHFLPEDRPALDRALVAGRSLVESGDSPLRRAVTDLVDSLFPETRPVRAGGSRMRRRGQAENSR